ncbi:MAG: hypothetical protein B6242_10695 [Anaerolineaceae bacterium 4572_78]|nr:MAG: hypothetical protein B6242_10695 [Anaerolineaceae bacterium 4572_78]
MRILIYSWEFPPFFNGGLGVHVAELTPRLAEAEVAMHVITQTHESTQLYDNPQPNLFIHRVDTSHINNDGNIYDLAKQVNPLLEETGNKLWQELNGFDIIHVHDWLVGFAGICLKNSHACPLLTTFHATEKGRYRSPTLHNGLSQSINQTEQNLANESDKIIVCSQFMLREVSDLFGVPAEKMVVIPNGINLPSHSYSQEEVAEFREEHLSAQAPLIFSIGRLVFEKGYHVLIGAMPQVLEEFPQAKLIIAGKGPEFNHLNTIAQNLNISDHVHLPGFISEEERIKFLLAASCTVFPSLYEPFGIVALEGMVFQKPVIASRVGGMAEIIEHEKTGILMDSDSSDSAAWCIINTLQNPVLAQARVANAYRLVEKKYSWRSIAENTKVVYEDMVEI